MKKINSKKEPVKNTKQKRSASQKTVSEKLRLSKLLEQARQFDKETKAHQKKNKIRPPSMKEIVEIVREVRKERSKKLSK